MGENSFFFQSERICIRLSVSALRMVEFTCKTSEPDSLTKQNKTKTVLGLFWFSEFCLSLWICWWEDVHNSLLLPFK